MKVEFFEKNNHFDVRAIKAGVYKVDLLKEGKKPLCLYIGESVWMATRCGRHLYAFMENPEYFALTEKERDSDEYILRFSVVEVIKEEKSKSSDIYKKKELEAIQKYAPLTQSRTSDRQSSKRKENVRKAMHDWDNID